MFKSLRLHLRRTFVRRHFSRSSMRFVICRPARRSVRSSRESVPVLPASPTNPLILKEAQRIHREMERRILKANGDARAVANARLVATNKLKAIERYVARIETTEAINPSLFGPVTPKVIQLQLREKYGPSQRKKRKSASKAQALQYKLQYYKGVRDGVRTRNFRMNTINEECFNDLHWSEADVTWLLGSLVERSFEEAFTFARMESTRVAEIMAWINRRFDDHPLSFESCCLFAGLKADELREMFVEECKQHFGTDFPHYQVLRNGVIDAEYGNEDAIEWVLSDAESQMSFVDCCLALGFDPVKARAQLLLPIVNHESDTDCDTSTDETLDLSYDEPLFGSKMLVA